MENVTFNSPVLHIEGMFLSEQNLYPTFLFFLFVYGFIMVSNLGIILIITMERSLHVPMYILFCNLPFTDVLGNTAIVPRLMADLFRSASERSISYINCAAQAFCYHMYTTSSQTILIAMAFDRYVAICNPLHYTTIMTNKMVALLSAAAWGSALILVSTLLGLTLRLNYCGTFIENLFCDNASLFKLACESTYINNVYGLTYTVLVMTCSMGSIALTYSKIAAVCIRSKNKTLNSKALKTCSTHLTVFLLLWLSAFIMVLLHRFNGYAQYRKGAALLCHIGPGLFNPIIYALQSSEMRRFMLRILRPKKVMSH